MPRRTVQFRAIQRAIESAGRPLSAQEVLASAQAEAPGLGITTVYRWLHSLTEEGWLDDVPIAGGARYECAGKPHHHYFLCRACDRLYDIDHCPKDECFTDVLPEGFTVEDHELLLHGLCDVCARRSLG